MSTISRDDVAKLAKLARLALTDDELDASGVTPTGNPLRDVNVTRPDDVRPGLTQQQALAGAPSADDGRFAVPQILGEEA